MRESAGTKARELEVEALQRCQQAVGWLQQHQGLSISEQAHLVHHSQHHHISDNVHFEVDG